MNALAEFLKNNHYPIGIAQQGLTGPGAGFLHEAATEARFMLVGEEHGVGSNLNFATALFNTIIPLGYRYYAAEIGPQSADLLNKILKEPDPASSIGQLFRKYPFSVPFFWLEEEVLLAQAAQSAGAELPLIGIDQEFVFSPQLHLETLHSACPDEYLREFLDRLIAVEHSAYRAMTDGATPDKLVHFMSTPLQDEWWSLRNSFQQHNNPDALALMDMLEESHTIYMLYHNEAYHENNDVRAHLMKQYFFRAYQKLQKTDPHARMLIKLGANHVKRGHSVLGIQDIGNFISEIAIAENSKSFHLLVIPVSGAQNIWLPFLPEDFKAYPIEQDYGAGVSYFVDAAPYKEGWNLYDLRSLRHRQNTWGREQPQFKDLFLGYDAILLMDDVRPATLIA